MHLSLIFLLLNLWGIVEVALSQNACSKLPDVPRAHVSEATKKPEYQNSDVIHFTCDPGYKSAETSKYICTSGGWLAVRQETCYSCSELPNVPHASISGETEKADYREGDLIHFTCDPGYLSGPTIKYVCTSRGWLAVHQGACYSLSCSPPPADEGITVNGLPEIGDPILPNHILTFSCEAAGKFLEGSSVLTCGEDGQWDHPLPVCSEKCRITDVAGTTRIERHVAGEQLQKGEKLKFYCPVRGHFLRGNAEVECLSNGQWSHPFPTCGEPSRCGRPPFIADADTTTSSKSGYDHGERVEYRCQHYYIMKGEAYKTCNNGEWTGEMRCLKPCTVDRALMNSHNIAFRYTYQDKLYSVHGDTIDFVCKRGTRPSGTVGMRGFCNDGVMQLPTCN
ncbi:complement factor H-related protein 1-like [Scomber japonicus]|uniref:complement factor H-related protein 1-like n=1 Tax=Scomber japonicus TaxID=13676 RepID=UPI0023069837|nr:complement factor H-related protein 1-like [Scomber japonicus]